MKKRDLKRAIVLVIVVSAAFLTSGCSTIETLTPEFSLPSQSLDTTVAQGQRRVVFFNTSNSLLFGADGSGKINIKLNNKALASLKIHEYVQIFLEPGSYDLYLAHLDIATFKSNYKINIAEDDVFIKVYSQPTSTNYKMVEELPADFSKKYTPAL